MKKSRVFSTITALALTVAAGLAVAAPASAADYDCASGGTCFWISTNFTNSSVRITSTKADLTNYDYASGAVSNNTSSISSNQSDCIYSYQYDYYLAPWNGGSGSYIYFLKGQRDPLLSNGGGNGAYNDEDWDNRISSNWFKGC